MNKIDVQLAPPHKNRRNLVERAIWTIKEQFKYLQKSSGSKLSNHIWCWLIPQANITLNIIQQARLHLQIST